MESNMWTVSFVPNGKPTPVLYSTLSAMTVCSRCGLDGPGTILMMMFQKRQHHLQSCHIITAGIAQLQWWFWNNIKHVFLKTTATVISDTPKHNTVGDAQTSCEILTAFVAENTAGNCPEVPLKITSGVALKNIICDSTTVFLTPRMSRIV